MVAFYQRYLYVLGQQCHKERASAKTLLRNLSVTAEVLWNLLQDGRYFILAAGGYPKCSRLLQMQR